MLVTGASRGIGEAIARSLAGAGARVVVHYARNADRAGSLAREIGRDAFARGVVPQPLHHLGRATSRSVETPGEVVRAVGENAGKTVPIEVVRNGRAQTLSVTLPEEEEAGSPVRPRARVVVPDAPPVHPARLVDRRMA